MKKILLILTFMLAFMPNISGQTGQIGTGTASMTELPINSCWGYNYSQQIYTAAEVTGAIGTSTLITKIRFHVSAIPTGTQANYNQWVVYIGNTAQNDFATTTSWVPLANLSQVYSGTLPAMTDGSWVELPLATPFTWDGISNLVVAVDENSASWSCTQSWGSYTAGTNRGMLYRNDSTNPNPATPPTATSRHNTIPRIQLVAFDPAPCTVAPPTGVTVSNLTSTTANVSWNANSNATYVVQYRQLPSGPWISATVPALTNTYTISGLTELGQYEVQVATICGGVTGSWSAAVPFTTPVISYCTATSTSVADGYITNVTANATNSYTMSSNSGSSFYTDYSADPARLITFVKNSTGNTVSVTKTWPGTQWSFGTGVWIDYNRNGVFETNEQVLNSPSNTTSPVVSPGFTIPAGVYNGTLTTRMRVVIRESASATACGSFTWGEVEDYAVKFVDLQPCTTAPPTNILVGNITPTSATVSWLASAGATYVIRYRTGTGLWTTVTLSTPPVNIYNIPGLAESTTYEVQVATICGGVTGAFSPSTNFTTPAITYCSAAATSADEYIANVTVTPLGLPSMVSNSVMATAAPYYSDYTADPNRLVTLIRGTVGNNISLTKVWPGTQFAAAAAAWIDFNRNGIFETSERILTGASNTTSVVTASFGFPTTPGSVYGGNLNTRMRVIIREGTDPSPCGNFSWGEVEDYAVKFIDLQPCTTAPPTNITVTNMTATTAYVSWMPTANATYVIRYRLSPSGPWLPTIAGLTLPAGTPTGQSFYTITGLTEQTAYQVQVATICGGVTGAFSASVNFTTPPLTYCPMVGTGTNDYISNVKVTPINFPVVDNTSLQTNYISYTTPATLVNLEVGSFGNQLAVSKAWVGTTFSDAVDAYIDYNRDGIFAANEKIMTSASSTTTPVTATFNVPPTGPAIYAGPLTTTMRVILKRNSGSVMCVDPANGEVEDYAVRLRPCNNTTPGAPTFAPITQNSVTINWTPATNNIAYILQYRVLGTTTWTTLNVSSLAGNPPVTINGLTPATTYEVQIAAVCGTGGAGAYTAIKTFTTRCDPTPPNVTVTNITPTSAVVTWNPLVPSATYIIRYRPVGSLTWITPTAPLPPANSYTITGLTSFVTYEVQVANICVGETTPNPWSNPQVFTTVRVCEIPPPGLTITTLTPTSAEVVWDAFTGAGATGSYILKYRKVGIPSWTTINVNTNTYTITGLLELTKYEMQVANVCSGTPGNFTPPYYFTTPTVVYCQMTATTPSEYFINKVTVKPTGKPEMVNEDLTGDTYSDFTAIPAKYIELIQGSTGNQITVDKTVGTSPTGVAVWIDFNRNGSFDLNERIMADGPNINPSVSATFSVPADAFVSMTDYKYVRMRVAMAKDAIPVNCLSFQNGEVEDYTVRISKQGVANPLNQTDIMIYPNPVSTVLNVKNISKKANYKIYSAAGQLVSSGLILNNKIDVSRLINGLYVIDIEDVKGTAQKKFIKE